MIWLLALILLCPLVLVSLLRPALMAADGGSRNPLHIAAAVVGWFADLITAHTTWPLVFGWPQRGEWTVSDTLERLCAPQNHLHWRYAYACKLALWINSQSPTGRHIKAVRQG